MRLVTAATLLLAGLLAATGAPAAHASGDPYAGLLAPAGTCVADSGLHLSQATATRTMLCLTNYARARAGLAPLVLAPALQLAGRAKLTADVSCGEFSHTPCSKPFTVVFARYLAGARGYDIGENIAWGTGDYGSARETMNDWLHSAGHRRNILTPAFHDVGFGYLPGQAFLGQDDATLWSQEFGERS